MFTSVFSYFSQPETISVSTPLNFITSKTGIQYRGSCQLVKGRCEVEINQMITDPTNIQTFCNNITNYDLVKIENKNTIQNGKFVIVSQNVESNAFVDFLIIMEKGIPIPTPVKEEPPKPALPISDLHRELLQRISIRPIKNEIEPIVVKKKEKTDFRKELVSKKNAIMNKRKLDRT